VIDWQTFLDPRDRRHNAVGNAPCCLLALEQLGRVQLMPQPSVRRLLPLVDVQSM
jgi:hypothetical protein